MNFKPKKSLGQNFLVDNYLLNIISNSGDIKNIHTVIEIGPGTGNLTNFILSKKPKKIIVIEKDKNLSDELLKKFEGKISVINSDFLKIDLNKFKKDMIIVFGNLPYNLSTQILIKLIKMSVKGFYFKRLILMFQKEVAERILANSNTSEYGRLSIISQLCMKIEKIIDVKPSSFYPKPKVDSTLLSFVPKKNFYKIKKISNLEHITNVFFNLRRKMIKKPLKILFKDVNEISKKLDLNLNERPQNLSPEKFYKICNEYEKLVN